MDLCNLPQFEELPEESSKNLRPHETMLYKEVDRLIAATKCSESPDFESLAPVLSTIPEKHGGFIVDVASHIINNLAILQYRSSLTIVSELSSCRQSEEVELMYTTALFTLQSSRRTLLARFACHNSPYIEADRDVGWKDDVLSPQVYDIVINHITASVAYLVQTSAEGPDWTSNCLAILARLGLALKGLKTNPKFHAERCLWDTVDLHDDLKNQNNDINKRFTFDTKDASTIFDLLDDSIYAKDYFIEQYSIRNILSSILTHIVWELRSSMSETPDRILRDAVNICTFIPGTHDEDALAVSSTSSGDIIFSTSRFALQFAIRSNQILRTWSHRKCCDENGSCAEDDTLQWLWRDSQTNTDDGDRGHVCIQTIEDAVTAIVHMALSSSIVAWHLDGLATLISSQVNSNGPFHIFKARSKVSSAFLLASRNDRLHAGPSYSKLTSLSDFAFAQPSVVSRTHGAHADPGREARILYERCIVKMRGWNVRNETIEVSCAAATLQILIPTLALAALGVVLFAAPYDKPKGVDPSNLMIFLWSLSLSFLLVCKAFFVSDWPWHDFIRWKVVCGSVNEIRRISGITD